jgi:hypothetical protein
VTFLTKERGFVLVSLLLILPVFISILAILGASSFLLKTDQETRHQCRLELLAAQKTVSEDLARLLLLNPLADSLRKRRALAPNPAALAEITAEQMALRLQQQILIQHARLVSHHAPLMAQQKISSALNRSIVGISRLSPRFSLHGGEFPLEASPEDSLTPHYETDRNFEQRQAMKVSWTFPVENYLSANTNTSWMKSNFENHHVNLNSIHAKGECSATLQMEGRQWRPILNGDR